MNNSKIKESNIFSSEEQRHLNKNAQGIVLKKDGQPDRRCKPAIYEPRPTLSMEDLQSRLSNIKEIETTTGIKYINLRLTTRMIIGTRESSGKEFTINLKELYKAYQHCLRFTSPEVKKYIFMGHSPAVHILRMLQNEK